MDVTNSDGHKIKDKDAILSHIMSRTCRKVGPTSCIQLAHALWLNNIKHILLYIKFGYLGYANMHRAAAKIDAPRSSATVGKPHDLLRHVYKILGNKNWGNMPTQLIPFFDKWADDITLAVPSGLKLWSFSLYLRTDLHASCNSATAYTVKRGADKKM